MKLKLDENLPRRAAHALQRAGHQVDTVVEEGLAGASDQEVIRATTETGRVLVTLDRGLGDAPGRWRPRGCSTAPQGQPKSSLPGSGPGRPVASGQSRWQIHLRETRSRIASAWQRAAATWSGRSPRPSWAGRPPSPATGPSPAAGAAAGSGEPCRSRRTSTPRTAQARRRLQPSAHASSRRSDDAALPSVGRRLGIGATSPSALSPQWDQLDRLLLDRLLQPGDLRPRGRQLRIRGVGPTTGLRGGLAGQRRCSFLHRRRAGLGCREAACRARGAESSVS